MKECEEMYNQSDIILTIKKDRPECIQKIRVMRRVQYKPETMKKYTIKEFAEGCKKAVKIENEEQWNKLNKVYKLNSRYFSTSSYYTNNKEYSASEFYLQLNNWEVLEFSQLDFEDEFVVNTWYKRIEKESFRFKSDYIYYVKCRETSEKSKNILKYSERINFGGSFYYHSDYCECDNFIKIDLSEIQQFLPPNHPDLIKKDTFVLPEKWKVLITDESKETLEKHRLTLPKQTSDIHSILCDDAHGKFYLSTDKEYSNYQFWGVSKLDYYTEITFEEFKTHVLKEKTMNTFGLKVGDHLPQEIIKQWALVGGKTDPSSHWRKERGVFVDDRTIVEFKEMEGVPAFVVSGTCTVCLKCEGFLEFKESFNKEKTMEKEIIGWKLVKPEYEEAAIKITWFTKGGKSFTEFMLTDNKGYAEELKKAGVLDLWFEPVCKEEFKKDDYVTVVSTSTYDYDSSSGNTRPVIGKTYKIYDVSTNYVRLDVPGGRIAIKSSDLRKATKEEIKKAQIQLPTINGKQCVDNGNKTITCGCTTKSFDWILGVAYSMHKFVNISGTNVSEKEIDQIVQYINKNK